MRPTTTRDSARGGSSGEARDNSSGSAREDARGGVGLAVTIAVGLAALYSAVSLRRHATLRSTGYDLGIFVQNVSSYASGHWPTSDIKGPGYPLLGDHFSPIWAVLAPIYRMFPTPQTLLVAQAMLLAVAVVPLVIWARRKAGLTAALVVGIGYGLSWGIAQTVIFDVHEVAFAVPLIACSLVALGNGRLRAAVAWAAPLVLVKEDLGLTLAAIGLLVAWRGARRLGLITAVAGVAATVVETYVVLPMVNVNGNNGYTGRFGLAETLGEIPKMLTDPTRLWTIALVLLPTGLLCLRSRLTLTVLPTLAWRMLSNYPSWWVPEFHYSAVLMPMVFAGMVDVLARPAAHAWHRPARWAGLAGSVAMTAVCLLVPPGNPPERLSSGLFDVVRPSFWTTSPHVVLGRQVLAQIPPDVRVLAGNTLAPQLAARDDVFSVGATSLDAARPDYVVVDLTNPQQFPATLAVTEQLIDAAIAQGYTTVVNQDGYWLLRAPATAGATG